MKYIKLIISILIFTFFIILLLKFNLYAFFLILAISAIIIIKDSFFLSNHR